MKLTIKMAMVIFGSFLLFCAVKQPEQQPPAQIPLGQPLARGQDAAQARPRGPGLGGGAGNCCADN